MSKLSKILYVIMVISSTTSIIMEAFEGKANLWAFNALCWVTIAYMFEKRALKAEKEINEINKYH